MGLLVAVVLLVMYWSADSYPFKGVTGYGPFVRDPELEWEEMKKVIADERPQVFAPRTKFWKTGSSSGSFQPAPKIVPEFLRVPASEDRKELFKPEKGARPLPDSVREMLLKTAAPTTIAPIQSNLVEVLCHVDRIYVRITRDVLHSKTSYKHLKLGTCPVNAGTVDHYYLLYLTSTDCGFQKQSNPDHLSISTVLHYNPDPTSLVVRELPFDIPIQCIYHRIHHSYRVGFYPKLQGGTVFRGLKSRTIVNLIPQDALGNEIIGAKTYSMGQPMYFEAKLSDNAAIQNSGDVRVYVNKCFMTASHSPNSHPKYTVIDNQGCMIDSKMSEHSKFHKHTSLTSLKFSFGAFIFQDMVSSLATPKQLYMHCEITVGAATPTQSSKACTFDSATERWKELYGDDSVCLCCESSCSSMQSKASRAMVSSHSWEIDYGSSNNAYMEPRSPLKSIEHETFNSADYTDFLKHWEHDY